MNSKSTWRLLSLSAVLLAYILVFERRPSDSEKKPDQPAKLFPDFKPETVTGIDIRRTNSFISVERVNDRWQIGKPHYPAQGTAIEEFLQSVAQLQRYADISPKEVSAQTGGHALFGLQPPKASVTLRAGTNQILFGLGSRTMTAEQVYLQLAADPRVYVADARILDLIPANANEWRNPLLMYDDRLVFDQLSVTNETSGFEIVRDSTQQFWRLIKPWPARADGNAVDYLVQELRSARVSQFVTDDPAADLEQYGLQAPKIQMTLGRGTNAVFQLQFGQSPTNNPELVFARRLSQSNIVLVSKELADLLGKPHTSFRDRTLAYFEPSAVTRVEMKGAKDSFALERQVSGAWQIVEPFNAPADSETMRQFFRELAKLEIREFERDAVTDFYAYGLVQPARRYVLKGASTNAVGATNVVFTQVDFGSNRVDRVFARRSDEPSVYTVGYGDMLRLPQHAFELRDRRIWKFASSNVVSITVRQRGQTRKLERNTQRTWSSDVIVNERLEETLHRLGELRAVSWRSKGSEPMLQQFAERDFQIELDVVAAGKAQPHIIRFGSLASEGHVYAGVVLEEGQWVIFLFPGTLFQEVVQVLSLPEVQIQ